MSAKIAPNLIQALLVIATRAIEVAQAEQVRREKANDLSAAYANYKNRNGIEFVERDSNEWNLMLASAEGEHQALQGAKRTERNARRRLQTAVQSYQSDVEVAAR